MLSKTIVYLTENELQMVRKLSAFENISISLWLRNLIRVEMAKAGNRLPPITYGGRSKPQKHKWKNFPPQEKTPPIP